MTAGGNVVFGLFGEKQQQRQHNEDVAVAVNMAIRAQHTSGSINKTSMGRTIVATTILTPLATKQQ